MAITVSAKTRAEVSSGALTLGSYTVATDDVVVFPICANTNFGTAAFVITKSAGTATMAAHVEVLAQQSGGQFSHHYVHITAGGTITFSVTGSPFNDRISCAPLVLTGVDVADIVDVEAQGGSTTNSIDVGATTTAAGCVAVVGGTEWNDLGTPSSSDLTDFAGAAFNGAGGSMSGGSGWETVAAASAFTGNLDAAGAGAADWDWGAVAYTPAGGAADPAGLTADPSELVAFFIRNQRQLHLWEGSPGAATVVVEGVAAVDFGGTFVAAGVRNVVGAAVAAFGYTATAAGHIVERGVAVATFGGTFTAAGVDRALGVAAANFGGTFVALGVVGTPPVQGQATATFGFTGTAAGVPRTPGAATATYGGTFTASGVDRALGVAAAAFGFTATGLGRPRHIGQAAASFGGTLTASGVPRTPGVAVATFGFTATALGVAGTPPVQGQATATFGFTAAALGVDRSLGVAVATFGFTATSTGHQHRYGTATATFGYTATVLGRPRVLGAGTASFGFTAAIFIITYQLRLVAVGSNRYTATTAASSTSTAGTGRYSATPSSRYSGAADGNRYSVED